MTESVCKTMLEKPLFRLGNGTHWSQIFLSLMDLPLWAQVPRPRGVVMVSL